MAASAGAFDELFDRIVRLAGRIVITGGGGFVGSAIWRAVIAQRRATPVVIIGPASLPHHPLLQHINTYVSDVGLLTAILREGDLVFHAAGRGTPQGVDSMCGEIAVEELRVAGVVLEAAARAKVAKVIVLSSGGTIYGRIDDGAAVSEKRPAAPISRYGILKLQIEEMALALNRMGAVPGGVARITNPYGPGQVNQRGQGLVATVLDLLHRGQPIEIWGDGGNVRDYIYIDDVGRGLLAAATLPGGIVCNVSSGRGLSTRQVIQDVAGMLGVKPEIRYRHDRDAGVPFNVLANDLLHRETGWAPCVEWAQGLSRTAAWWVQRQGI